jgi:hypothetical protein
MWLNYLVWCSRTAEIIPGNHPHFEWPYIQSLRPDYLSFIGFYVHSRDYLTAPIRLGSHRAWFNFFLNVNAKKGMPVDYNSILNGAKMFLEWHLANIDFNLDWCLIFEDPEHFVHQLNSISGFGVKYNSITEQAFDQYRDSCIAITDHRDLQIQAWRQASLDLFTNRKQPLPQRLQIVEEMFYNTYYRI